jgi:hypothetical protein
MNDTITLGQTEEKPARSVPYGVISFVHVPAFSSNCYVQLTLHTGASISSVVERPPLPDRLESVWIDKVLGNRVNHI